jgi:AraC-like DNA-binding protein
VSTHARNLSVADTLKAELVERVGRAARSDGARETSIAGLMVVRASEPSQPLPSVYEPSLCIVVQGRKQARLIDEIYTYDPLHYLVVSVTLPMIGQITEASPDRPYLCLRINIDRKLIGELLMQANPALGQRSGSDRGLYLAAADAELLDAVVRLVRLIDHPQDAVVLAPLILREIHYRALSGALGERLREVCIVDSQIQRVARAIDALRARFAEPFRIEDLASIAHMSPSSFHHRFKQVTAMSPVQFQKQLRLHEARRLMLTEGLEASSAAHRVGYESPSQFSREYRRLFGAPPRREVGAIRAGASMLDRDFNASTALR